METNNPYIDTIHLLVITHVRGLKLPIPFFQVLPNDYLYYNISIAIECPKTLETVRYEGEYRFSAHDEIIYTGLSCYLKTKEESLEIFTPYIINHLNEIYPDEST